MSYQITAAQFSAFAPNAVGSVSNLVQAINQTMARFGIDQSYRRVRYFMAQTSYESAGFSSWEEDLVYDTPERLVEVWPSRFSMNESAPGMEYAPDFVNAPEKLANLVYANEYGNGAPSTEDGYLYRGRGALGLTFLDNYSASSAYLYNNSSVYLNNPDLVAAPTDAFLSAGWFWTIHNLNALADSDSFTETTRSINGSTDSVDQRLQVLTSANTIFTW
jgi:putative chitinase